MSAPQEDDAIPDFFTCPITLKVMKYPFQTEIGHSYEYSAIAQWLKDHDTDPKTNVKLTTKSITPNHSLRASIDNWLVEHPEVAESLQEVERPPAEAYQVRDKGLDQIVRYCGTTSNDGSKKKLDIALPQSFAAFGHTYRFTSIAADPPNEGSQKVQISCDDGPFIDMPDRAVFATQKGLVFYDPTEYRDARVLPGTDTVAACKYQTMCTATDCPYAHPFVCWFGVACRKKTKGCKFQHPSPDSVVPVTDKRIQCKYNTSCSNQTCIFAHSSGRMTIPRVKARICVSHSLTLEPLPDGIEVSLDLPEEAICFQIQGQYVCSFQPYPGTWAKRHFKFVTVHRFDDSVGGYKTVDSYSLGGHYCNSAAVGGRYIIISFWPFEDEAMRTAWECLRVARTMEKDLKSKTKLCTELKVQLEERDQTIAELKQGLAAAKAVANHASAEAAATRQDLQRAREEASAVRREAAASENRWRQQMAAYEYERAERLRQRDPIHIYALADGATGARAEEWCQVLDYHKGAHGLELGAPALNGIQTLDVTLHKKVHRFELVVPRDVASFASQVSLPLQPNALCTEF